MTSASDSVMHIFRTYGLNSDGTMEILIIYSLIVQIRTVLDIGCGYGSFGAHLFSKQLLTMCIASYEVSGSQVQFTLERGLPAMIGSFTSKQLLYPSLSFDMLHCAQCGIEWEQKGIIHGRVGVDNFIYCVFLYT